MSKAEPISCLKVVNPPLPEVVRKEILPKLRGMSVGAGQTACEFATDGHDCSLMITGESYVLGSHARGQLCFLEIAPNGDGRAATKVAFLADVSL